jgi:hypothetical protein
LWGGGGGTFFETCRSPAGERVYMGKAKPEVSLYVEVKGPHYLDQAEIRLERGCT